MPSTLPSSFASAAAGTSPADGNRRTGPRSENNSYSEWTRRPNGATQTFRRPSVATNHSSGSQRESASNAAAVAPTSSTNAYVPPHVSNSRANTSTDLRYSKGQMLSLYKELRDGGSLEDELADLYVGEGDYDHSRLMSSGSRWTRPDDSAVDYNTRPELCLTAETLEPLGLVELTEEEKERFTTSVNSTIKAPNQATPREGTQRESIGGRKTSFSSTFTQGSNSSPTAARSLGRRRDTNDSFTSIKEGSTTASSTTKSTRDEADTPRSTLQRRRTDIAEPVRSQANAEPEKEVPSSSSVFGSLRRTTTGPFNSSTNGPTSPWSTSTQNTATIGGFGGFGFGGVLPAGGAASEKRPSLGGRGESRFKGLMAQQQLDPSGRSIRDKTSQASLEPVDESMRDSDALGRLADNELGPDESRAIGSAALGGANDEGSGLLSRGGETERQRALHAAALSGLQDSAEWRHRAHDSNQSAAEPLSPTFTNPYQSPEQRNLQLHDFDNDYASAATFHLPGLGHAPEDAGIDTSFGSRMAQQAFESRGLERGPIPTSASARGFGGFGSLGGLGGLGSPNQWPSGGPMRDNFLDSLGEARSSADVNPGRLAGLGGTGIYGTPPGAGAGGQNSRLGALFSAGMSDPMRSDDGGVRSISRDANFEGTGPQEMELPLRETESPYQSGRSKLEDFLQGTHQLEVDEEGASVSKPPFQQTPLSNAMPPIGSHMVGLGAQLPSQPLAPGQRASPGLGSSGPGQPPAAQQKTMVMPDRIRWIYRDTQGNTQGPWSGLEMHDWYRAGFFSPELLVKKVEDSDYEPLAQLIRRIGNSREPFLVPQIGIPGPPTSQTTTAWPAQGPPVPAPGPGATQPPFANSFPSFGTTLTADQQNALERRKQEEQYLMARQKEHLAAQQVALRQMQMQAGYGFPAPPQQGQQQLQHHSSAQSLQSQASFGSMTSPNAFGPPTGATSGAALAGAGGPAGAMDANLRAGNAAATQHGSEQLGNIEEETQRQMQQGIGGNQWLQDSEGAGSEAQHHAQMFEDGERLRQFHELQQQQQQQQQFEQQQQQEARGAANQGYEYSQFASGLGLDGAQITGAEPWANASLKSNHENLTLTEQVQKAASAKERPADNLQSDTLNNDIGTSLDSAQRKSPLPAPAARRENQNLAQNLVNEGSSSSASPVIETPSASVAPWAREANIDAQKQPSLKEIQEAEARRAAEEEEAAAIIRRANLEKELANQQQVAAAAAPGLPSTSTWASAEGIASPSGGTASTAWTKPQPSKGTNASGSATKKTLQQIQKEEQEALARQKRAAAAAAAANSTGTGSGSNSTSAGKRYADLAGKSSTSMAVPATASAWTTVGASGKTKSQGVAASTPVVPAPAAVPSVSKTRPSGVTRAASAGISNAFDELKKWAIGELKGDLQKSYKAEDFVDSLMAMPEDVIPEVVHSASQTISSRHFAEEFIRRKALALKGKAPPTAASPSTGTSANEVKSNSSAGGGGGWSEVARKGSAPTHKEENSSFKIVAAKKKSAKK